VIRASIALLAMLLALPGAGAEEFVLQIVALKHRTAAELIPSLQPLAVPGATVASADGKLILRSTPANLTELMTVVSALDRPARRLLISVRHDTDGAGYGQDDALSARYQARPGDDGAAVELRSLHTRGAGTERAGYQVQTVDGAPAYIATGESVPLAGQQIYYGAGYPIVADSVQYRDLHSGFYVVARLSGEQVTLDVRPRRERLDPHQGGIVNLGEVTTTVTGRLGEWLKVAGSSTGYADAGGGLTVHTQRAGGELQSIWIKVDELP
jgi:hypothetical protein